MSQRRGSAVRVVSHPVGRVQASGQQRPVVSHREQRVCFLFNSAYFTLLHCRRAFIIGRTRHSKMMCALRAPSSIACFPSRSISSAACVDARAARAFNAMSTAVVAHFTRFAHWPLRLGVLRSTKFKIALLVRAVMRCVCCWFTHCVFQRPVL